MTSGVPDGQFVSTGATCAIFRCSLQDTYLASYQARKLIFIYRLDMGEASAGVMVDS